MTRRYHRNCEGCGQRDYCHESNDGLMLCGECREGEKPTEICRNCGGVVNAPNVNDLPADSLCYECDYDESDGEAETYTDKRGNPVACADRPY